MARRMPASPGLQRDVQVGCDDRRLGDGGQQVVVHGARLDRGDPQADEPADRAHGPHEAGQAGAGGRVAIGPDVDARSAPARGAPRPAAGGRRASTPLQRPALGRAAGGGDDAERAARVAPVLHLQEGPRAPGARGASSAQAPGRPPPRMSTISCAARSAEPGRVVTDGPANWPALRLTAQPDTNTRPRRAPGSPRDGSCARPRR